MDFHEEDDVLLEAVVRSLFLTKLQTFRLVTLSKTDSYTGAFL